MPEWVTDEFYADLQAAVFAGNDYVMGDGEFIFAIDLITK